MNLISVLSELLQLLEPPSECKLLNNKHSSILEYWGLNIRLIGSGDLLAQLFLINYSI